MEKILNYINGELVEPINGNYFYNVKNEESWEVANCLTGEPQKFSKDKWIHRQDKFGN